MLRVIICAVSLLVLGGAIFTLLKTFESRKTNDHRKAEMLRDYGLLEAFKKLAESPDWNTGFTEEPFEEGGSFSVEFKREERGDTLYVTIVSTGVSGSISLTTEQTVPLPQPGGVPAGAAGDGEDVVKEDTQ